MYSSKDTRMAGKIVAQHGKHMATYYSGKADCKPELRYSNTPEWK